MDQIKSQQFGAAIRARRRQLGLTQSALARMVAASVPYIGHLEAGKRHPSEKTVRRLAEALNFDSRELFFLANPTAKEMIAPDREFRESSSWEIFCRNQSFRHTHHITDEEMDALAAVSLLGEVRSPRDFLFILNTIRQALA